jgi:hypothetical protein
MQRKKMYLDAKEGEILAKKRGDVGIKVSWTVNICIFKNDFHTGRGGKMWL